MDGGTGVDVDVDAFGVDDDSRPLDMVIRRLPVRSLQVDVSLNLSGTKLGHIEVTMQSDQTMDAVKEEVQQLLHTWKTKRGLDEEKLVVEETGLAMEERREEK